MTKTTSRGVFDCIESVSANKPANYAVKRGLIEGIRELGVTPVGPCNSGATTAQSTPNVYQRQVTFRI